MPSVTELKSRIEFKRTALCQLREAYLALASGGVQSYTIGSRSLTRFDLEKLSSEIRTYEKELDGLEAELAGGKRRKAVGVVPVW